MLAAVFPEVPTPIPPAICLSKIECRIAF